MMILKHGITTLSLVTLLCSHAFAQGGVNLCQIDGGQDVTTTQCDSPAGRQLCGGSFYKDIAFAKPFSAPPHVVVSPNHVSDSQVSPCASSATDTELCYPANITTTGFRLYCSGSPVGINCGSGYDGYLTSATASWLAFDSRPVCDATSGHSVVPTTCPGTFVGGLCSSVYQTNQIFSSPLPGAPQMVTIPEHFSEQAGCVGYSTDFFFTQGTNISKSGFTLSAGGSPRASCGSYEGWVSYAKAGFFGIYDRPSCSVSSQQMIEADTCPGVLSNGTCTAPFRKTITFSKTFATPPKVFVTLQHASSNPPCAGGATDTILCRVVPGSVTTTNAIVECSGSPEGAECGATQEGYFTRARFGYVAIDSNCAVSQCKDGLDNDGDGLTDSADPACFGNPDGNNESGGTTQCQDGLDNDQDGAIDYPNDFSCSGKDDNDEANPKSQCQDSVDNDTDGLIDAKDPGCSSNQDNSESDGTTQCQDGLDNDQDGAIDYPGDFSCSGKKDNDEANPKSQCQDSVDNDSDGLIDTNDPGCASNQDNSESDGTTQCQDGIDNDQDGATDYPDDFSCSSKQDNDETNPRAQCQDGVDNDNDGLIDANDPGCSSKQDNSESDGTTQCQDTRDNDGDGLIDMNDPGCSAPSDNDESNGTSQCQDTLDNDSDGLIDMRDPGCSSPQDNNEADEGALFSVGVECITKNVDKTTTAYFSYNNTTGADMSLVTDSNLGTINQFISSSAVPTPPTLFKSGLARGAVAVTFTGDSLTWQVRAARSASSQAVASSTSTSLCAPVIPIAECRSFVGNTLKVRLGYSNRNTFDQQLPIGVLNTFTPGAVDKGQPIRFFAGLNKSVFEVALSSENDRLTWNLNGTSASIDNTLPLCEGQCVDTPTGEIKGQLDDIAVSLSDLMNRAAATLGKSKAGMETATVTSDSRRSRLDAERARAKAKLYQDEARSLLIEIPAVVKTCPQAPQFCATVDRGATIEALGRLYGYQENSIRRTIARSYFRNTGNTTRQDKLVKQAKTLRQQGNQQLAKLPRFATECK